MKSVFTVDTVSHNTVCVDSGKEGSTSFVHYVDPVILYSIYIIGFNCSVLFTFFFFIFFIYYFFFFFASVLSLLISSNTWYCVFTICM